MYITKFAPLMMAASVLSLAFATASAQAQSLAYTTPHLTTAAGSESTTLGGTTFTNQGLVGIGRLSATTRDFAGETLGSFSGMAIDLSSWRRTASGGYTGKITTLPDRGPNDVGPFVGTTDYRNRLHTFDITLAPYTGAAALPAATTSQNQLVLTPTGGTLLTDATGKNFTGKDAGSNVITRNGILYPSPASGEGAGKISLDSEALAYRADGSFYISDEYAANIYYFNAAGQQVGAINTVKAILPTTNGVVNFDGANAPTTGRRNNQGLEALSITPDGQKLVTILQSATVQDTNGANQQTRNNTRILVYDIANNATPTATIAEYALQLPIFTQNGNGAAANRTAAQSEMLALNDSQFLVLSRDGIGRGSGASASNSPVYKSVLLVDTTGATNLAGTSYENGVTPLATNGNLVTGIAPVKQVELVNMLNPVQLGRFGMNLNTAPSNALSLSEKFEAMGLVPVLEESAPQDFFLLVGNDNDFITANGLINGKTYDASLSGAGGTGNNDNVILVYRLTLPTYVDPMALAALKATTPIVLSAARRTALEIGALGTTAAMDQLSAMRRGGLTAYGIGARIWAQGDFARLRTPIESVGTRIDGDGFGAAGGIDVGIGIARVGASVAYQELGGPFGVFDIHGKGTSVNLYGGVALPTGLYLQLAGGRTVDLDVDRIDRPSAYGLTAHGSTGGKVTTGSAEIGWSFGFGILRAGPYLAAQYAEATLDRYVETGASLGNASVARVKLQRAVYSAGIEARAGGLLPLPITPSIRVGYSIEDEMGDRNATVALASAQHAMGTAIVALPGTERNYINAGFALEGDAQGFGYRAGYDGRFADGRSDHRVTIGLSKSF